MPALLARLGFTDFALIEYIRYMWFRSALASLLTAIMLCVSCSASTCALNCEMKGLKTQGQTSSSQEASAKETVPDHCGHVAVSTAKTATSRVDLATQVGPECGSRVCSHDLSAAVSDDYRFDQPAALVATTTSLLGSAPFVLLPNHGVSDLLPHAPPRRFDVLRL